MPPVRVKRTRKGDFLLRLTMNERDHLRALTRQLRELLTEGGDPALDPAFARLYPAAYPDDPVRANEFDGLVRPELTRERLEAIAIVERTLDAKRLSEEELVGWLGAVNDIRLVLGTRLDVTEQSLPSDYAGDERRQLMFALFWLLGAFEEEIVTALGG